MQHLRVRMKFWDLLRWLVIFAIVLAGLFYLIDELLKRFLAE